MGTTDTGGDVRYSDSVLIPVAHVRGGRTLYLPNVSPWQSTSGFRALPQTGDVRVKSIFTYGKTHFSVPALTPLKAVGEYGEIVGVVNVGATYTHLVLFNASSATTTVTLTVRDASNNVAGVETVTLVPGLSFYALSTSRSARRPARSSTSVSSSRFGLWRTRSLRTKFTPKGIAASSILDDLAARRQSCTSLPS